MTKNAMNEISPRRGGKLLLELLESEGVEYVFGNPGTTELPFIDALIDSKKIKYIWGLQEASVVAMADGYAQASGRPGFVNLHTAGGLGHGLGNLLNAKVSGTPLVVTAGQQDSRHSITDPLLFGDLTQIATPAVKWAQEVHSAAQLPILIRRAFEDCAAAQSGPVFLSLPMDVMEEMTSVPIPPRSNVDRRPVAGSLDLLADELAAIKPGRIAIIAGDEISNHDATPEVVALAEMLGAPVFGSSWPAHLPYPTNHSLWAGNLPTKATEIHAAVNDFDCIFALGGKSFITILYSEGSALPEQCELFQLSVDGRDLGRSYPTKLSVVGDIQKSLKVLNPLLSEKLASQATVFSGLLEDARQQQRKRHEQLLLETTQLSSLEYIHPLIAAQEMARGIGSDTAIVDEAVVTAVHLRKFLNRNTVRRYSFLRGGALGWGMPAAIGYSLGLGREPVVCLVGDGAALYSPQAMWTAAHEKLPITFVVVNNREYNVLKNFMRSQPHFTSARENKFIAMDIVDPVIDYLALAKSMGIPAKRIERASDIAAAIQTGIATGRPNLIEILVKE
ncbi:thiamine pyrophosphate-binding protein [uncultured Desulfuromusa sp.]|uniref:thiamine pyrophosphate-binding protein n=1 Tax=uncultured Desulfuromusa sp. TaxID=219183 RepID=UPI002AA80FC9|nr:thiamine pyrophosphate-binding protein [uncultured Desulfuromusa sp.]